MTGPWTQCACPDTLEASRKRAPSTERDAATDRLGLRWLIACSIIGASLGCSAAVSEDDDPPPYLVGADADGGSGPFDPADGSVPKGLCDGDLRGDWAVTHVGRTRPAGTAAGNESTLCVEAAGGDIWRSADDFMFVHRRFTGDFTVMARVSFSDANHPYAKAGLMVRAGLGRGAVHAMANITPRLGGTSEGDFLTYREARGGRSRSFQVPEMGGRRWLRLSRRGDRIRAEQSGDGERWRVIGQVDLPALPDTVYVGPAFTSHHTAPAKGYFSSIGWSRSRGCGDGVCEGLETCSTCSMDCSCTPQGVVQSRYQARNAPSTPRRPAEGTWRSAGDFRYASVDPDVRNHYSNVPAFNADDSLILLSGSRPPLVDAASLDRIRFVNLNGLATHHAWLNREENAHLVFAVSNTAAYLVDVFSDRRTRLYDFSREYDEIDFGPGEGAVSTDDRMVALVARRGNDAYVLSFDIIARRVVGRLRMRDRWRAGERKPRFDYAMISRSGRWVLINTRYNTRGGIVRWDVEFRDSLTLTGLGKHSDACVNQAGEEVLVSLTRPPRAYRISDGAEQVLPTLDRNWGGHVSCQNTARPGWAYVSRKDTKELFAIRLDGSRTIERFGWHFSTEHDYRAEAHPSVSRDGSRIIFNSDWGSPSRTNGSYLVEAR